MDIRGFFCIFVKAIYLVCYKGKGALLLKYDKENYSI